MVGSWSDDNVEVWCMFNLFYFFLIDHLEAFFKTCCSTSIANGSGRLRVRSYKKMDSVTSLQFKAFSLCCWCFVHSWAALGQPQSDRITMCLYTYLHLFTWPDQNFGRDHWMVQGQDVVFFFLGGVGWSRKSCPQNEKGIEGLFFYMASVLLSFGLSTHAACLLFGHHV